jgi:limonene-1,2-epoxide hydrolase
MSTASNDALGVVIGWLDAMRREDREAVAHCFKAEVTWRGLPEDALCRNRDEVLDMLEDRLAGDPPRTAALELIGGDAAVVLGARSDDLQAIGDVPLPDQLYNVFEVRDGQIASVRDFSRRRDALHAARAGEPHWT